MKIHWQTFVLLGVGICGIFAAVLNGQWHHTQEELPDTDFPRDIADNPFLIGQYYFNHDEDPAGPYDLIKARQYYEQALHENPGGNNQVWYQLGRIDFLEGNFSSALFKFDKQIEYFEDQVPNVYYMIGLTNGYKARRGGMHADWVAAAEGFEKYLEYEPNSPWARTDLAWVYFAQGKFDEMIPILERGLEDRPHHPWLLNMYGLALMNTDKLSEAVDVFEEAQIAVEMLTVADWGSAYPGNDPADWEQGLSEFQTAVKKNVALAKEKLATNVGV